jgi:hypothetical protein
MKKTQSQKYRYTFPLINDRGIKNKVLGTRCLTFGNQILPNLFFEKYTNLNFSGTWRVSSI